MKLRGRIDPVVFTSLAEDEVKKDKRCLISTPIFNYHIHHVEEVDCNQEIVRYTMTKELLVQSIEKEEAKSFSKTWTAIDVWFCRLALSVHLSQIFREVMDFR